MDNGIVFILIVIAACIGASIVWLVLRKNLPPGANYDIGLAVAYVQRLLGATVTEAEVRALASWAYDKLKLGSQYYTKEAFVNEVARIVLHAFDSSDNVSRLVAQDSALAATMTQARSIA